MGSDDRPGMDHRLESNIGKRVVQNTGNNNDPGSCVDISNFLRVDATSPLNILRRLSPKSRQGGTISCHDESDTGVVSCGFNERHDTFFRADAADIGNVLSREPITTIAQWAFFDKGGHYRESILGNSPTDVLLSYKL